MSSGSGVISNGGRRRVAVLGLMMLFILITAIHALGPEKMDRGSGPARGFEPSHRFRAVVFILDSAGRSEMFDPTLMPFLTSLRTASLSGRSRSCAAKTTFPCIKSIFEGREAAMGTTLQDFSAFASSRATWPASLAALGTRLVVASDHTLNRLYPHAFVDSLNYEDLHVPLRDREEFVYRKARQWFDDPSIDVLLLHIIGTDKIAHEYKWRGPEYLQKYREVDDFIREIAGRLQPEDYLYAISDHGHNELGGHTEEAGFLVRGPIFPVDVRADLNAEDMLFLLSAPYGLLLPWNYEGQVRMDLTRLAPETVRQWIDAQASAWHIPVAGLPSDQAQARLNEELVQRRTAGRRNTAVEVAWRCAPFLLTGVLFLIGELRPHSSRRRRWVGVEIGLFAVGFALVWIGTSAGGWLLVAAACVRCWEIFGPARTLWFLPALAVLGLLAFWLFPASLTWVHDAANRPIAFIGFYLAAALAGFAFVRWRKAEASRSQLVDVLWVVALAVWLFAYFGPLGYSLTRHGSLVVLTVLPIAAVIIAGGWSTFFSRPALFLPGLLPLVYYDVESFNLKYLLVDRIPGLSLSIQLLLGTAAVVVFALALQRFSMRNRVVAFILALAWFGIGDFFFHFDGGKLIGALLACSAFGAYLELFRRAQLPPRWFSLLGMVFIFVLFTFSLNGLALSHVDFRFANDKIIPFPKELWRAPQLIVWAISKYAFILLPAIILLRLARLGNRLWTELLVLTWWRHVMIAIGALGLAIFNARGMRDSCEEEMIFWTFLNILFLVVAVILTRSRPNEMPPAEAASAAG